MLAPHNLIPSSLPHPACPIATTARAIPVTAAAIAANAVAPRPPRSPSRALAARLLVLVALVLSGLAGCGAPDEGSAPDATEPSLAQWVPGHYGDWFEIAPAEPPFHALLISIDTTRQDHLSAYGFAKPTTPHLDELAREGVLFERATAPTPVTLPSHTTMMTGLYPFHHGVRNNGTYVVADSIRTLAEAFEARGYRTGAILGAFPVAKQFGLDQGFSHYDDEFPKTSTARESDTAQRRANEVTDRALAWLDANSSAPTFLWAHYFDPHFPYDPPEPYRTQFAGDPYSGEIAFMDAEIGRLLAGLESRGLLDRTVIAVAADHGEGLGQHREMTHSFFIYNTTQRVPMLLRLPKTPPFRDGKWRGKRIEEMVSLVDLLPTLLHAAGLPQRETPPSDGKTLLPLVSQGSAGHSWVYHETLIPRLEYGTAELRALERKQHKYIRAPRRELYDLDADPNEESNIAQRDSWIADEMEQDLSGLLRREGDTAPQVTMDAETIERLRSLGYLAGSPAPSDAKDLPDPKDMIWAFEKVNAARTLMAGFRFEEALAKVDSVLAQNPNDGTAARIRAAALVRLERGAEAKAAFDELLANCDACPDQAELLRDRAIAAMVAGEIDDALQRTRALQEARPDDVDLARLEAQILASRTDSQGARDVVRKALEEHPDDVEAWAFLGELEFAAGRIPEAEQAYQKALELQPNHVAALVGMIEILIPSGRVEPARGLTERAFAADPNHPGALFRKGWFAKLDGRTEEAIEFYRRATAGAPDNAATWHNLGNAYLSTGRMNEAFGAFQKAVDTGQATQETFVNLGVLYAQQGRMAEAIAQWQEAIRRDPSHASVPQIEQNIQRARQEMQRNAFRPQ